MFYCDFVIKQRSTRFGCLPRWRGIAISLCLVAWLSSALQAQTTASQQVVPPELTNPNSQGALTDSAPPPGSSPATDGAWAKQYLVDDPLVAKPEITLEDIQAGIASPRRRATIIERHFRRVTALPADKRDFLARALQSEFPEVQRQAARELEATGELTSVVQDLLTDLLRSPDAPMRQLAAIALEKIENLTEPPEEFWQALIDGLASEDPEVVRACTERLVKSGVSAIPSLLTAFKDARPRVPREAASILARILAGPTALGSPAVSPKEPTPTRAKAPPAEPTSNSFRKPDNQAARTVRVYFGTNREVFMPEQPPWSKLMLYPAVALLLVVGIISNLRRRNNPTHRGCLSWLLILAFMGGSVWSLFVFRADLMDRWRLGTGPRFGPHRDHSEQIHYGTCDVSIPPNHQVGEVESPGFGPEDVESHVVLQKTDELQEAAFYDAVKTKLAAIPEVDRACFVFIHGFNVSFENAAKRTAQIHFDLQFSGVPIFFSWPSRASVRHYFSDRNEIEFSRYVIKQFLIDISERVDAKKIHVIAHSMGADATCRAIAELGERGKIFDQIILAAPDIDRDVFRVQLAPRMAKTANRLTLYCSKNDWALLASETFNDAPRAGDSRAGVLVMKEVDTVDASGIDTDLLGHSYYGDCLPILHDVQEIISQDLSPAQRHLQAWPTDDDLAFWTLTTSAKPE